MESQENLQIHIIANNINYSQIISGIMENYPGEGFPHVIGDGMRAVIMGEFGMGDAISPRSRVVSIEDLKVHFNFLVYPFSLSI